MNKIYEVIAAFDWSANIHLDNLFELFFSYQLSAVAQAAAFFAICIIMCFYHVRAIAGVRADLPWGWYGSDEVRINVALLCIFVSGAGSRGHALTLLQLRSWGFDTTWLEELGLPLVWGAIFIVGGICYVRVISRNPKEWKRALAGAVFFVVLNLIFHGAGRAVL